MAQLVTAPTRNPRTGGIKDVASFIEETRLAGPADSIVWDAVGCDLPSLTRYGCFDRTEPELGEDGQPVRKSGVEPGAGQTFGDPFALYAGVECWIGGDNEGPKFAEQARALLEAGEDRPIEVNLWAWANGGTNAGARASLIAAIAAADAHADRNYVAQPVIILSRENADLAFAAGALARQDDKLVTATGTPVLATSAAPDDRVAAVGAIVVYRTPVTAAVAADRAENRHLAIAESVYAIGVDCDYRAIVTIQAP